MLLFFRSTRGDLTLAFLVKFVALVLLLCAEVLILTVTVDSGPLSSRENWASLLLSQSSQFLRFLITLVIFWLIIAGARSGHVLSKLLVASRQHRWWVAFLVLHLVAFAWFLHCSSVIFSRSMVSVPVAVGWSVLGLGVAVFWALANAPWKAWQAVLQCECSSIALAAGLALVVCLVGRLAQSLWDPLGGATLAVVRAQLMCVYQEVVCGWEDRILGTPAFQVRIAPECSGHEGMALITTFLVVYLCAFRKQLRFPNALLLLPVGSLTIWYANTVRIAGLVMIGSSISPEIALGGFHSQAGWIGFCAVGLCLVAISRRFSFFAADPPSVPLVEENGRAPYLLPFLVALASVLITSAVGLNSERSVAVRVLATLCVVVFFRHIYLQWTWRFSWQSVVVGCVVFLFWRLLAVDGGISATNITPASLAWRLLGFVVVTPFVEELAFRGYLIRRLIARDFQSADLARKPLFPLVVSSVAFGLLHSANWLPGSFAGILFGLAYYRRGQVANAVLAHATCNALIVGYVLMTGNWWLWG